MKRLYKVKYRYSLIGGFTDPVRTAALYVEANSVEVAARLAAKLARRACKMLGDEKFTRILSAREIGEVTRGN